MSAELAVAIGFLVFCAVVLYFRVPSMIAGMLDTRAERIRVQLDEARTAREEAQKLLASFERKHKDVEREAEAIVERARADAKSAAEQAKIDIQNSIDRKLKAAEQRLEQAEKSAAREVRNAAASAATQAAREVLGQGVTGNRAASLVDDSISGIGARLN